MMNSNKNTDLIFQIPDSFHWCLFIVCYLFSMKQTLSNLLKFQYKFLSLSIISQTKRPFSSWLCALAPRRVLSTTNSGRPRARHRAPAEVAALGKRMLATPMTRMGGGTAAADLAMGAARKASHGWCLRPQWLGWPTALPLSRPSCPGSTGQ